MAAILGVTEGRLRQMVKEGMPRAGEGLYPLAGCVQWYVALWKRKAEAGTNSRHRVEDARATQLENKTKREAGLLVEKAEVVMVMDEAFLHLGKSFESLPATLTREARLPPEASRLIRARLDEYRRNLARDLGDLISPQPVKEASGKRKAS